MDLITSGHDAVSQKKGEEDFDEIVGSSDRLEGCLVRSIWVRSRLDREKLSEIW